MPQETPCHAPISRQPVTGNSSFPRPYHEGARLDSEVSRSLCCIEPFDGFHICRSLFWSRCAAARDGANRAISCPVQCAESSTCQVEIGRTRSSRPMKSWKPVMPFRHNTKVTAAIKMVLYVRPLRCNHVCNRVPCILSATTTCCPTRFPGG